ncbi:MAG: dockerin type I domain-containing protein [Nanoarchaeota archaeon]
MILMLTLLLLLVSFFSSATITGSFWRESATGEKHIKNSEEGISFARTNFLSPNRFFFGSGSRQVHTVNRLNLFANGKGDVDGDGIVNKNDCYELQLRLGRISRYTNSQRIPLQFNQPQTLFDETSDITDDGVVDSLDVDVLCRSIRGIQDTSDVNRVSQLDCTKEGITACMAAEDGVRLFICLPDPDCSDTFKSVSTCPLTWVKQQVPKDLDPRHLNCISGGMKIVDDTGGRGRKTLSISERGTAHYQSFRPSLFFPSS